MTQAYCFGLDATPLLHGERAIKRHSRNLLQALIQQQELRWKLLYIDRSGQTEGHLALTKNASEHVCRMPARLQQPLWKLFNWPSSKTWLGNIDAFYAPDLWFPPNRSAPTICTIRGLAYKTEPERCLADDVRSLNRAFAYASQHAQHFLAVSESCKKDLLHYSDIKAEQIHVISHGIDPCFFQQQACNSQDYLRQRFKLQKPYFLFVGVIAKHKNVQLLVEAMRILAHQCQHDLVLAGPFSGDFSQQLQDRVKQLGLQERVHFLGNIAQDNDDLYHLYHAATSFTFPSFYEGWCAPPLEAMACGTAVIASNVAPVYEVVQKAAISLPTDDVEAWAAAMLNMAKDPQQRQYWQQRGQQHSQQHTWQRSAKKLSTVMQMMTKQNASQA